MILKRMLTREEAGQYIGLSGKTLENWQHLGKGPRYTKIGSKVNYDISDLDAWIEEQKAATKTSAV